MKGILVNYEFCTGCHSCEVACKKHLGLPAGEFGIKLTETGPFEYSGAEGNKDRWEWTWLPVLTKACDMCAERTDAGQAAHVRAALPGVVYVLRRGGGAGAQDRRYVALRAAHALSPSKAVPVPGARARRVREGGDARGSSVFYS